MIAAIIGAVISPVGRWVAIALALSLALGGAYLKVLADGRAAYKAEITKEIYRATTQGNDARAKALRDFDTAIDNGSLPDDGFERP